MSKKKYTWTKIQSTEEMVARQSDKFILTYLDSLLGAYLAYGQNKTVIKILTGKRD